MRRPPFPSAFKFRRLAVAATGLAASGIVSVSAQEDAAPATTAAPAETGSIAMQIAREVRALFDRHRTAVVRITATDEHGSLSGTGFFIDPNGTLLTAYSIGGASDGIAVEWEGRKCAAQRLLADPRSGVAILKIEPEIPVPFLTAGDSSKLEPGDPLVIIGFPMDRPASPSWGTLASFDIMAGGRYFAVRHIRARVPVQRGEGGAPLLNMSGQVVGILISDLEGGSGCFSLPIEAAARVRKDFVMHGEMRPGWLGVGCREATRQFAGSSAVVDSIAENSPAADAGLKKGDILLQIEHREIHSPEDVLNACFFIAVRDAVKIRVLREGEPVEISVTAVDPPGAPRTAGEIPAFAPSAKAPEIPGLPIRSER